MTGLSIEVVRRTPKPTAVKIARIWAAEWSKEGLEIAWQKLLPRRGFEVFHDAIGSWSARSRGCPTIAG